MNTELISAIGAAIFGVLIAFFITNLFIGEIEGVSFTTVESDVSMDLADPDPEVFNYKALNPTVEVYVGNCAEYNAVGECIDEDANGSSETDNSDNTDDTDNTNNTNGTGNREDS